MGIPVEHPRLTSKGARTRRRIIEGAAQLIHEQGVSAVTLEDVKSVTGVSSSQLYHYFFDKQALVQEVIDHQAETIIANQTVVDLGTVAGIRAWRDLVVAEAVRSGGRGGCPLGSLAGQLAETDAAARARIAAGFDRWNGVLRDGLRRLDAAGGLCDGADADSVADALLAALQGGLMLAQVSRDPAVLETAIDVILRLALVR